MAISGTASWNTVADQQLYMDPRRVLLVVKLLSSGEASKKRLAIVLLRRSLKSGGAHQRPAMPGEGVDYAPSVAATYASLLRGQKGRVPDYVEYVSHRRFYITVDLILTSCLSNSCRISDATPKTAEAMGELMPDIWWNPLFRFTKDQFFNKLVPQLKLPRNFERDG